MKIDWIEKLIKKGLVKSYNYSYSYNGELMFVDINIGKSILFADDLETIQKYAKKSNAKLQYISTCRKNDLICQKLAYVMR